MENKKIAIIGGGIIGCTLSYYLLSKDSTISLTLIEATEIASAASGKAGGFLARNWHTGPVLELAALSFKEHELLADQFGQFYDWQRVDTRSVAFQKGSKKAKKEAINYLNSAAIGQSSSIGSKDDCALIKPFEFTKKMFSLASEFPNFTFIKGRVTKLHLGKLWMEDGSEMVFDSIVCAIGPWSSTLVNDVKITPQKAHSVIVKVPKHLSPIAVFGNFAESGQELEIYPRIDEIYVCGDTNTVDQSPLPATADLVVVNEAAALELKENLDSVCPITKDLEVKSQACYIPHSEHPILEIMDDFTYIAAGHSVWGILLAPATAKVLTELILNGKCDCVSDLSQFSRSK